MKRLFTLALLAASAFGANAQLGYSTAGTYLPSIVGNDVTSFSSGLEDALISSALPGW